MSVAILANEYMYGVSFAYVVTQKWSFRIKVHHRCVRNPEAVKEWALDLGAWTRALVQDGGHGLEQVLGDEF